MKVMLVFGTRPEAIKCAPVIRELQRRNISQTIVVTGQHREMLDQMLKIFKIDPHHDLDIMTANQTLGDITAKSLSGLMPIIEQEQPTHILVQGDTTTAFLGALSAYYHQIPVGHIEAGLRTDNKYSPFPEEINRRLITQLADLHFAPTLSAKENLVRDGVQPEAIHITGNTVVDSLLWVKEQNLPFEDESLESIDFEQRRVILVTAHRRENVGAGMDRIFNAIRRLAQEFDDIEVVFPVHLNPNIQAQAKQSLAGINNVHLIKPLAYTDLVGVLSRCYLVLTDSGGIQEEAPALGKPVLVMRDTTERHEGIQAGTAILVGTDEELLYEAARKLLVDQPTYQTMAQASNPYGDGQAARHIAEQLTLSQFKGSSTQAVVLETDA